MLLNAEKFRFSSTKTEKCHLILEKYSRIMKKKCPVVLRKQSDVSVIAIYYFEKLVLLVVCLNTEVDLLSVLKLLN